MFDLNKNILIAFSNLFLKSILLNSSRHKIYMFIFGKQFWNAFNYEKYFQTTPT